MKNQNYIKARNLSWQVLIESEVTSFPIKITKICKKYNIDVYKYSESESILKNSFKNEKSNNDGFAIKRNNKYYIFYNDKCINSRCRFVIAHELGHILLGHLEQKNKHEDEQQANIFASRVLAPSCVINALEISNPMILAKTFDISVEFATYRLDRMKILNKRKMFLTHYLEKQVFLKMQDFINHHQK